MRNTIFSEHTAELNKIIQAEQEINNSTYKQGLKRIHTSKVTECRNNYKANKVLNRQPPDIHAEEKTLPRRTRTLLAQIRSGYSPHLQSYLHRIGQAENDRCPKCQSEQHTSTHLFECQKDPTDLVPEDLWVQPIKAAAHLQLDIKETDLEDEVEPG